MKRFAGSIFLFAVLIMTVPALMLVAGCSDDDDVPSELLATWQLREFRLDDGAVASVDDPAKYTVRFESDNTANIGTDCNSCSGSFTVDGDDLEFNIVSGPTNEQGTLILLEGTQYGWFEFVPADNYNGTAPFTFSADDGEYSIDVPVEIQVIPVNDPPVVTVEPESFNLDEDTSASGTITFSDPDGETTFTYEVDGPGHGTLSFIGINTI